MKHLERIKLMHDTLRIQNLPSEYFAYRVTKEQANEMLGELKEIHCALVDAVAGARPPIVQLAVPNPTGWQCLQGAMYDGVRIIVL